MMHGEEAGLGAQGRPLLKLNKLAAPSFGQATPRIILAILQASGGAGQTQRSFAERRNGRARIADRRGPSADRQHASIMFGTQESYLSGGIGVARKVGRNASRMEGSTELEAPRRATWKALDGPCCSSSAGTRATTTGPFTESILIDDDWDLLSSRADVTSSMAKSSSSSTCGSECSVVPNEYNTVTKRSANTGANRRGTPTGYSRAGLRTRETRAHLPA